MTGGGVASKACHTSPHVLQMLPQDLSSRAVWRQAQESLPVQAAELGPLQPPQRWAHVLQSKLCLAPVQPVAHLPVRPQAGIWTVADRHNMQLGVGQKDIVCILPGFKLSSILLNLLYWQPPCSVFWSSIVDV